MGQLAANAGLVDFSPYAGFVPPWNISPGGDGPATVDGVTFTFAPSSGTFAPVVIDTTINGIHGDTTDGTLILSLGGFQSTFLSLDWSLPNNTSPTDGLAYLFDYQGNPLGTEITIPGTGGTFIYNGAAFTTAVFRFAPAPPLLLGVFEVNEINIGSLAPVPEPTTVLAGALLLLPFGASALRRMRKSEKA